MELLKIAGLLQTATGSFARLRGARKRSYRSRGRTNRLRRFGPHTLMIRQRLTDLESLQQAACGRGLR